MCIFVHQNGNGTVFSSLRAACEDTNSSTTPCLIISQHFHNQRAVFYGSPDGFPTSSRQVGINYDKLGRRSPTTQRIHRIYGGAPAISCASASHAPKRYTTSPALWRAQGSLNLRPSFARPSLDLRLTFAHPSLSQTATLRWLFGMVFGWDDIINKNEYA